MRWYGCQGGAVQCRSDEASNQVSSLLTLKNDDKGFQVVESESINRLALKRSSE